MCKINANKCVQNEILKPKNNIMFGIKHKKFDSMTYVFHYKNGKIEKEGRGLSFFYLAPNSSIVAIPLGSNDLPFVFKETTNDYQSIVIQGQISYKISNPKVLSEILDFTIDDNGLYKKNDIEKLNQRIINEAQTATSAFVHGLKLKEAIRSAETIKQKIEEGLHVSKAVNILGIEILGANILNIQASPEMTRALETETREQLQQEADEAIYFRRNFAVEQERIIKESELNTEIAIEEKQKQIAEKKMESAVQKTENEQRLKEMKIEADISIEEQKKNLIILKTSNDKKEAETKGYVLETTLKPYKDMDWKVLTALNKNTDPAFNIALAFRSMAENADKIGNLNISPDLIDSILDKRKGQRGRN